MQKIRHGGRLKGVVLFLAIILYAPAIVASSSDMSLFQQGYQYWQKKDALKAYSLFEQIHHPIPPIDDLRLYATGVTALESDRLQHGTTILQELISTYPNSPWRTAAEQRLTLLKKIPERSAIVSESARMRLAETYLKSNQPAEAVKVLEPLVHMSAHGVSGATDVMDLLGTATFRAREYSKAAVIIEELLKRRGGNDVKLMVSLASAYARSDQFDKAIAMQRRLTQVPTEAKRALYKIVFLEFDRMNDRATIATAKEYMHTYATSRDCDEVIWMMAWSYFRLKEWASAISAFEDYRNMVRSQSEKSRASYWMARSFAAKGDKSAAASLFSEIARHDSGDYYGYLASARLHHKSLSWRLIPIARPMHIEFGTPGSAAHVLSKMGFYELMPVVGETDAYRDYVEGVAPIWGLTPALVLSLIYVESHFRPEVVSNAGAVGLMQLIFPTALKLASDLNLENVFERNDLRNPVWNVMLGMSYLRQLSKQFSGQLVPMIASYNAGEDAVVRWIKSHSIVDPETFVEEIPYDETRAYVKKILPSIW